MLNKLICAILSYALLIQGGVAYLGTIPCPHDVCHFNRGHYHIQTILSDAQARDFRTFQITKDYATRFDIVFIVKISENFDPARTRINVGGQSILTDHYHYTSVSNSRTKIFKFKDLKNARIAILSFQENVAVDVYYFMDCGFKMDQFTTMRYPESSRFATPILKMLDPFASFDSSPVSEYQQTCWFIVPRDNYRGWANIERTYVIVENSTLGDGVNLNVADALSGEQRLLHSGWPHTDKVAIIDGQLLNETVDVGMNHFPATTVIFVELVCPNPWDLNCKFNSRFDLLIKPLTKEDTECIKKEEYCRFGAGESPTNYICQPEDMLPSVQEGSPPLFSSKCSGLRDLLQVITMNMIQNGMAEQVDDEESNTDSTKRFGLLGSLIQNSNSERRMAQYGMCSDYRSICRLSSIRHCRRLGGLCRSMCIQLWSTSWLRFICFYHGYSRF